MSAIASMTSSGSVVGRLPLEPGQDVAVLVDDSGGDLGAADVDPDGELVGHQVGSINSEYRL